MSRRLNAATIRARKGARFPVVTAYDAPFGKLAEAAGIDVVLCGDSLGMVVLGYDSTTQVTMEDMRRHTAAVARGTSKAHIIADLPFGSYEASDADAVRASIELIRSGASSVKIEGGLRNRARIAAIAEASIPVVGHIGVLPQTAALEAGFKRKTDREQLFADLQATVEAGAFAVVLEMVDFELARELTAQSAIPTIGIGAGPACDAQVLVMHDLLGIYEHAPPFARRFAEIGSAAQTGLAAYAQAVRDGSFPAANPAAQPNGSVYSIGAAVKP
jgi:3-methyl-2-oxobutanoate hydroxymethyltransferase